MQFAPWKTLSLAALLTVGAVGTASAFQEPPKADPGAAPIETVPIPPARPRPPLMRASLSNGLKLFCRTNDASEIVSVVCLVKGGLVDEREDQAGLAALTAEAMLRGTTTHPGTSFLVAQANAGGAIRSIPGYDFTEFSIVTGRDQFEAALKLMGDVISHPRFEQKDVEEAREAIKQRATTTQDDFTSSSYQSLVGQLYTRSPYGRPLSGYTQTLDKLTAADVKRFWQQNYVQNRMVVTIVGDVDARKSLTVAQKAFQDVQFQPSAGNPAPAKDVLARPRVELLEKPGPAAQVMVGFLAPGATRENYATYAVLDAIIGGGKRGRLFSNIREKHSLGYEMGSFYQPLLHQSHLVGYVITPPYRRNPRTEQPEAVVDLVRGHLLSQYQQLATAGPTDQELARARSYVVGRYALRQERSRDQAKWLAWNVQMGLGPDFDQYFMQKVQAVTKEQIQAAAKAATAQYALVVTMPAER